VPALLNAPSPVFFSENIPLRDQPPVINTVPGASEIQEVIDNTEWVSQSGNPVAYAPHLRQSPLHGTDPPPVIIQFAKGDQTVPNPTASAIFRAGDLDDRSTFYRNDLAGLRQQRGHAEEPARLPHQHRRRGVGAGDCDRGPESDHDLLRD
jgi:hypothetical protein